MNASEIKIKRRIEGEMFETIPSSQSKSDDIVQLHTKNNNEKG
jgi:hypothetical protein